MGTILDKIVQQKKIEVAELYETYTPVKENRKTNSLVKALDQFTVIAEVKRASPSKGDINLHVDVRKQVKTYEEACWCCFCFNRWSIFKGSFHDLQKQEESNIPLLCKDFIIDKIQIDRAYEAGADIILLIVAALTKEKLKELYSYVLEKGLEAIVEVHDEQELEIAIQLNPHVIGINNRNLKHSKSI